MSKENLEMDLENMGEGNYTSCEGLGEGYGTGANYWEETEKSFEDYWGMEGSKYGCIGEDDLYDSFDKFVGEGLREKEGMKVSCKGRCREIGGYVFGGLVGVGIFMLGYLLGRKRC